MALDVDMNIYVHGKSIKNLTKLDISVILHTVTRQVVALQKDDTLYYYHDRNGFLPFQYVGKHYNVLTDKYVTLSMGLYNHKLQQETVYPKKTDTSSLHSETEHTLLLRQISRYYILPGIYDRFYVPLIDPYDDESFYLSCVFLPPGMIATYL
jgi:hypothetical protein